MLAGISTACLYPQPTEEALKYVTGIGVQAAEIFFNAPSELKDAFTRQLRRIADDGGTKIVSVHPFTSGLEPLLFFSEYKRRYYDGIELYKQYFHAANMLGAKFLIFHGNRRESSLSYENYFDLYGEVDYQAKKMGIRLAQENVPRCTSCCPEFFRRMRDYLPDSCFTLDIKQALRAGFSLEEMAASMGRNIVHLHISDHTEQCDCLPIGKGTLELGKFLRQVKELGFDGGVLLELYNHSYENRCELADSYETLLKTVENM